MASSTTVDQTNTTEVSDCPQCGSVCVGAFLLPCGHLVCRKCLRDHHGFQLTCSICNQSLTLPRSKGPEDFNSLVQQLGVDPVMVQLVDQRLRGQGRQSCVACENRDATSLCHDCMEQYCDGCSKVHRNLKLTKDHVLQTLPQALHNVSSAGCDVSRPRTDSASFNDLLDSIGNLLDQPTSGDQSCGIKKWKQWVKQQVGLLQASISEQDTALTSLTDVMSRVQKLLAEAQARQQLLQTYVQSLPSLAVTEHSDVDTFNVSFNDDDVSMSVKTGTLQNRFSDVIHQQPSSSFVLDMTSLIVILQDLVSKCGAAIQSPHVSRLQQQSGTSPTPQPVTTQQSGTSPTTQPVTTQQSGAPPTPQPVTMQQSGASPTPHPVTMQQSGTSPTPHPVTTPQSGTSPTPHPVTTPQSGTSPTPHPVTTQQSDTSPTPQPVTMQQSGASPTPQPVTTQQSGTSPTPQPVTMQQSGASPTPQPVTTQQSGTPPTPQPVTTQQSGTFFAPQCVTMQQSGTSPTPQPVTTQLSGTSPTPQPVLPPSFPVVQIQRASRSRTQGPRSPAAPLLTFPTLTPTITTSPPTVDPMKATPGRVMTTAYDHERKDKPWLTSMVRIEGSQKLVMSDFTPQTVTTQQSGTSPTPQPVTTQQSGTSPTQPALPSPSKPASPPSSQRPSNVLPTTSPAVKFIRAAKLRLQGHRSRAAPTTLTPTTLTPTATPSPPTVDPMKATPRRAFTITPASDKDTPGITSIVSIEDGQRLVMSDSKNRKVNVVDMHHPHNVSASLTLNESPRSLAVLPDKLIAVTTYDKVIYLLKTNPTDAVSVMSCIRTNTEYGGIAGHSDGNLIVSCGRHYKDGVVRIDIISRSGRVVRTIADSDSLTQLDSPYCLYSMDNHIYVSDYMSNAVLKVDLNTGQLLDTMTHPELRSPRQITADTSGHLYIACESSHAVLVRSPSRQWRKFVEASQHSDKGFGYPFGVCVTSSGRLLVAWVAETGNVVIAYDL